MKGQASHLLLNHDPHICKLCIQAVGGLLAHDAVERVRKLGSSSSTEAGGSEVASRFLAAGGPELVARVSESVGMWKQVIPSYNLV